VQRAHPAGRAGRPCRSPSAHTAAHVAPDSAPRTCASHAAPTPRHACR
jgi:hypothetical protein